MATFLVGTLLLQVAPTVWFAPAPATHHACEEEGFCPRNPDGPCICRHAAEGHHGTADHHTHESTHDEPSFRTCGGVTAPGALPVVHSGKALPAAPAQPLVVPAHIWAYTFTPHLVPQRRADGVFRPPRGYVG